MTTPTCDAALAALAGASPLAMPAVAVAVVAPPDADAKLVALAGEIEWLCAPNDQIYEKRIDPFQETNWSLVAESNAARDAPNVKRLWDKAGACKAGERPGSISQRKLASNVTPFGKE